MQYLSGFITGVPVGMIVVILYAWCVMGGESDRRAKKIMNNMKGDLRKGGERDEGSAVRYR